MRPLQGGKILLGGYCIYELLSACCVVCLCLTVSCFWVFYCACDFMFVVFVVRVPALALAAAQEGVQAAGDHA